MRNNRRGLTLIELLITLVIIAVAAMGAIEAARFSQVMNVKARYTMIANMHAQNKIESIKGALSSGQVPSASSVDNAPAGLPKGSKVTTSVALHGGRADLYLVTVTVSWPDSGNLQSTGGNTKAELLIYPL